MMLSHIINVWWSMTTPTYFQHIHSESIVNVILDIHVPETKDSTRQTKRIQIDYDNNDRLYCIVCSLSC